MLEDPEVRFKCLREQRFQQICRARLQEERQLRLVEADVKVGDWIVFWLSDYERSLSSREGLTKYSPKWSLPAKVSQVKDKTVIVKLWGDLDCERQVPVAQPLRPPLSSIATASSFTPLLCPGAFWIRLLQFRIF